MKQLIYSALAVVGLSGCGDVLAGTWSTTSLPPALGAILTAVKSTGATNFKGTLVLSGGKNAVFTEVFTPTAANTTGCTVTNTYNGSYTASGGISITFTFASGTDVSSGCAATGSTPSSATELTTTGGILSGNYEATSTLDITGSYQSVPFQWSFGK